MGHFEDKCPRICRLVDINLLVALVVGILKTTTPLLENSAGNHSSMNFQENPFHRVSNDPPRNSVRRQATGPLSWLSESGSSTGHRRSMPFVQPHSPGG